MDGPNASPSGMDTTNPSGSWFTAASINCDIATMSNVSGARYSTFAPVCCAASSTPFFTTDQNGSFAWPCDTTIISAAIAGAATAIAVAVTTPFTNLFILLPPNLMTMAGPSVIRIDPNSVVGALAENRFQCGALLFAPQSCYQISLSDTGRPCCADSVAASAITSAATPSSKPTGMGE